MLKSEFMLCSAVVCFWASNLFSQFPSAEKLIAEQQNALAPLKKMDGKWRGTAWTIRPDGKKIEMVQTERVGSMLEGAAKAVEGRAYDEDGKIVFNAFAMITYDPMSKKITMRSTAQGRVGEFEIKLTKTGFTWEIPAGPATIRYVAEITEGKWTEYGERLIPDQKPFRFMEMNLRRIGDTDWPSAGAVQPEEKK
ncbi:MAG: hypothetical protein R3B84_24125 [Zavarzinella sp.]